MTNRRSRHREVQDHPVGPQLPDEVEVVRQLVPLVERALANELGPQGMIDDKLQVRVRTMRAPPLLDHQSQASGLVENARLGLDGNLFGATDVRQVDDGSSPNEGLRITRMGRCTRVIGHVGEPPSTMG